MLPDWKTSHCALVALLLVVSTGCRSSSPTSTEEAIRRAQACVTPDTHIPYLPASRADFEECLDNAMREPAGRRFLLDAGNEAVARWTADMARFVGDDLGLDASRTLPQALLGLSAVQEGGGTGRQVGVFYRQLVRGVFANENDRRNAAAEVVGTMTSFLSQGPGKATEPFTRNALERLPGGNEDEVTRALVDVVNEVVSQFVALSFWADERIRSKLLAGDPPVAPAKSPPVTTPPLEDPPGKLHVPGPDQPAYSVFSDWYDRGDGLPLATAAMAAVQHSGVLDRFLQ